MKKELFLACIRIHLLIGSTLVFSQTADVKTVYYYPKDSLQYERDFPDQEYHRDRAVYGKTTMLIHVTSKMGTFDYVFKKKIKKTEKFAGGYQDVYGTKPDGSQGIIRQDYITPYTLTEHDLYAFVYLYDHGGFLEKARFQDFGNVVYAPEFDYQNCFVSDEDKDGKPEFYLTYKGFSDGLDPIPHKQIVYTIPNLPKGKNLLKAKATRFPIKDPGTETEAYPDIFDAAWKQLPKKVQQRSLNILNTY